MSSGTIKIDYDATLKIAQEFDSAADALADCKTRSENAETELASWDGMAAANAKATLELLGKALGDFDSTAMKISAYFSGAAQTFSLEDEKAAKSIKAEWDS